MSGMPVIKPLSYPSPPTGIHPDVVATGLLIPAIERIKILSDRQWEEFVLEWADSRRELYSRVERCGGAGDMGRDVVATCKHDEALWDNYQCKHYTSPLSPINIWIELGKLVYYTHRGDYTYPQHYFFVAPQGAGTKLSNLFRKPHELKAELITNWVNYCQEKITSTSSIRLEGELKAYLDGLDFSIFEATPPLRLIDEHAKTRWHIARFGGGLPARPPMPALPSVPLASEANYVRQLLDAYGDHLNSSVATESDLHQQPDLFDHFRDARLEFYSAESLRAFSRDTLPPNEFERLQDEIHSGIKDELRSDYQSGYRRVIAVVRTARCLHPSGHSLYSRLSIRDYGGICHQLANDKKVRWIK